VSVRRLNLGDDHLSSKGCEDPLKLFNRAQAQSSIYQCALAAGVSHQSREMQLFARSAFLLCRQCGLANIPQASKKLFYLACKASTPSLRNIVEHKIYSILVFLLGWCNAAKIDGSFLWTNLCSQGGLTWSFPISIRGYGCLQCVRKYRIHHILTSCSGGIST
jgi:hypothetical protein